MEETPDAGNVLSRVRDRLHYACQQAFRLAEHVEGLEAHYRQVQDPQPTDFYVPTAPGEPRGRHLDAEWLDDEPPPEIAVWRPAINGTLKLREAVDAAIEAIKEIAFYMDSAAQPADQRWTFRTIGELRKLRGAIERGHVRDLYPSALPMIRAGVPEALRDYAQSVSCRMEDIKTAIAAEVSTLEREDSTDRRSRGSKPRQVTHQQARLTAEAIVKREGFPHYRGKPSVNRLAEKVGCSPATMRKAIKESLRLQEAKAAGSTTTASELEQLIAEQDQDRQSSFA
ncbi:MAG: hypothetical protein RBS39_09250 [Phycisphaerales bacterium]|jgi:hypothetical protein|nr:hypothetical protein [Phycisphaerales bacterium]